MIETTFNWWWRASRYEIIDGEYVLPAEDAEIVRYEPWQDVETVKGGPTGLIERPYQSLLDLQYLFRSRQTVEPSTIARWYESNGALGLLLFELQYAALYPVWGRPKPSMSTDIVPIKYEIRRKAGRFVKVAVEPERTSLKIATLTAEQKMVGELVPQDLWPAEWLGPDPLPGDQRPPDHGPGAYIWPVDRERPFWKPIAEAFGPYFPRLAHKVETYQFPAPYKPDWWRQYAEPVKDFRARLDDFADTVRIIASVHPDGQHNVSKPAFLRAMDKISRLASDGDTALRWQKDHYEVHNVPRSLLSTYAVMVQRDAAAGILRICARCERIFTSNFGRARFCTARCRQSVKQREYRERKKRQLTPN